MAEPRFAGRPPIAHVIAELPFTANDDQAFGGDVPPWVVLAGAGNLDQPTSLQFTRQLPAVTYTIKGTVEAKGAPPASPGTYTILLFVTAAFRPNQTAELDFEWPAGEPSIEVEASISVPSGYDSWSWNDFSFGAVQYRDFEWTVIE